MSKQIFAKIFMILLPIPLLISAVFLIREAKKAKPPAISRQEVSAPTPLSIRQSRWATDSGVLKTEQELKTLSHEIETVDLKESNLLPPIFDMQVKF